MLDFKKINHHCFKPLQYCIIESTLKQKGVRVINKILEVDYERIHQYNRG